MDSRREFIKKAALLSGLGGLASVLPPSIERAFAINPAPGTTFLDAKHVVILMQENRSFDHCFGTLNGVRGFNDPRAFIKPDKKPVWFQTDETGKTYAPFRLNIKDTKSTWMGSLPHSWTDQVDARNNGRMDKWLIAKKSGHEDYKQMPLTLGYYTREDIPFYYSLADAFTVCDQNFCSTLTGTTPNRLHLWTGKIREDAKSQARVRNEETDYGVEAQWKTFPERLEEKGVSWKIYQNEISRVLEGEKDDWLANFTDNPLEWFSQYNVGLHTSFNKEAWDKLSPFHRSIHKKAFTTNVNDPEGYHELVKVTYDDHGTTREMNVPKGDVLYQFRKDVNDGKLPVVSWLVAPSNFSDHPGSPWYGAWYLSEAIDILTKDPEVWKKTIFILCYDENDGYFDHVPPFIPPDGTADEYQSLEMDMKRKPQERARGSMIGLGYRVPLIVASPWSRGGAVNSQVYDHTSILMFLEQFLSHKTGKKIVESNISSWRRMVCGDLTSVFKPYDGGTIKMPAPVKKKEFYESIHAAQFRKLPVMPDPQTEEDIKSGRKLPAQEKGVRPSNALPYELHVIGVVSTYKKKFSIVMLSGGKVGAPFHVYAYGKDFSTKCYAVAAQTSLADSWPLDLFENGRFHFRVDGPNGFMREFKGDANDPREFILSYDDDKVAIECYDNAEVIDNAYGQKKIKIKPGKKTLLTTTSGWYDFTATVPGTNYSVRFAGRVETGKESITDPALDSPVVLESSKAE